jgi:hypothetical protein
MSSDTNKMHPLAESIVKIGDGIPPGAWPEDELRGITKARLAEMLARCVLAGIRCGLESGYAPIDIDGAVEFAMKPTEFSLAVRAIAAEVMRREGIAK